MKLLDSFSFRLAATYALVISVSLGLLLGAFQLFSVTLPREQVKAELREEFEAFASSYRGYLYALASRLEQRSGAPSPRAGFHLLAGPKGDIVSTNLPSWPAYTGAEWRSIEADIYRDGDEDDHQALAIDRKLPDGSRLLVGRDVEELDDLEEALRAAAFFLLGATLVLAMLGALLMNRAIGRRLDAVGGAARRVMGGDLSQRVPLNGSGDDFDRLADTLNLMLDKVESGVEAVRTVSDSIAHELRTPLARLQASLGALEEEDGPSPALAEAMGEADRLQAIFDALLRIARIESGRHGATLAPVNLSALLDDVTDLYAAAAEDKGIRFDTAIERDLHIVGDRDLIFQAMANLIDNGIKFTPPGGRLTVAGRHVGSGIEVRVTDTGPGLAPELKGRIGQRFLRGDGTADVPGFGLGLSLVQAIARLHGSQLDYRDGAPGVDVRWRLGS